MGTVTKHIKVESNTQLAAASVSLWYISAMFRRMDAQGTELNTIKLALIGASSGRKPMVKSVKRGNTTSFPRQVMYTNGRANSFLKDTEDNRIPRMNMQSGVVMLPIS